MFVDSCSLRFQMFLYLLILLPIVNSCPLTSEFFSSCHCGILTNGQSYIECRERSLWQIPIFKRSFPYDELRLRNNFLRYLPSTSFEQIKTIKRIDLFGNSLRSIEPDLFRSLGNYLEELTLTGDEQIESTEFLTRFPLKKLRRLKLDRFDLSHVDLTKVVVNLTKLEFLSLRSCQLKTIPRFHRLIQLDLSDNRLSTIDETLFNENLTHLNLTGNQLRQIHLDKLPTTLIDLSLARNFLRQIDFPRRSTALKSLDLSSNQLKSFDQTSFINQLISLNLSENPLECICQFRWMKIFLLNHSTTIDASHWTCALPVVSSFLSADFRCSSTLVHLDFPETSTTSIDDFTDDQIRLMLIGSCLGGVLTILLSFSCCYLCYQLCRTSRCSSHFLALDDNRSEPFLSRQSETFSQTTESTQIDSSLKHIYQTVDSHENKELFHCWSQAIRQKR